MTVEQMEREADRRLSLNLEFEERMPVAEDRTIRWMCYDTDMSGTRFSEEAIGAGRNLMCYDPDETDSVKGLRDRLEAKMKGLYV